MGTAMQSAMGSDFWNSIVATTQEKYVKKTAVRTILSGNGKNGNKPVSPVLAKMMAMGGEETLSKGGRDLNWAIADVLPEGGAINPYAAFTASRKAMFQQAKLDWATLKVPMLLYGMDQILNSGPEAVVNKLVEETDLALVKMAQRIAQGFYSDGTNYWDAFQATPAAEIFSEPAGAVPLYGLGLQTTSNTVTNAICATGNTYACIDRTVSANYRLRANVLLATSSTDMGAAGAVTNISDLTLAHIQQLLSKCRRGMIRPNLVTCGQEVFDRLLTIANAKGIVIESNTDKDLNVYSIPNFIIGGATVVADPDFCPPTQINAFSVSPEHGIRLYFASGEEPSLSQMQWLPLEGHKVNYMEVSAVCQIAALNPGLVGCIYGLTVA